MSQLLRQGTSATVLVGPWVDKDDGVTPEDGITMGTVDGALLVKHDSSSGVDITGRTWALLSAGWGWYVITLTTGDVDTEGRLSILFREDATALPVWRHFMVVGQQVYDSIVEGSDLLAVDMQALGNAAGPATALAQSAQGIVLGQTQSGTLTNTDFSTDLAETTVDHYKDRAVVFVEGALAGQGARITGYDGAGVLSVTPMTEAPAAGVDFVIV